MGTCVRQIDQGAFEAEVLQHSGTVLVDFFTPECGPCKMIAPTLEQLCSSRDGVVKIVKIDASENFDLGVQYGIRAVPTLILFKGGQRIGARTGLLSKTQLDAWIDQTLAA